MTPFEYFIFTLWILTCVAHFVWEKRIKKKIRRHYRKKYKKKLIKVKKWKKDLHIDGD